jgi:hypothetical protein
MLNNFINSMLGYVSDFRFTLHAKFNSDLHLHFDTDMFHYILDDVLLDDN